MVGTYLNPKSIVNLYGRETRKPYFVDKTEFLTELFPLVEQEGSNISITRPRRFGKSVMAAMIASFFNKGADSRGIFSGLKIAKNPKFEEHINQHNVIYINFSKGVEECRSYDQYISYIKKGLSEDIEEAYPEVKHREGDTIGAMLRNVIETYDNETFILVFDEWDYVFHRPCFTESDRGRFTSFLGDLTKDQPYIEMTYLTGVLPIKKYSVSDTMNHFDEYNMANSDMYSGYFGFTEAEVDELYQRYQKICPKPVVTREDQAGIGYVDYIFYPYNRSDDGIIIELKVDDTPETALKQIKDKNYAMKFQGKLGEQPKTTGRIILVGIGYNKKDKVHRCKIEVLT